MRLCVSGTCSQGKSTFIEDFIKEWPNYTTPDYTYREFVGENHSIKANKDTQWKILNSMIDEMTKHPKEESHVIYDRGPVDNIIYSIWAESKGTGGIDAEYIKKCLPLLKETCKFLDIILFIPITQVSSVQYDTEDFLADKEKGLVDENYRVEIDHLFKALKYDWDVNDECRFCDPADRPAIIEVFGSQMERIQMLKMYLNVDGDLIDNVGAASVEKISSLEMGKIADVRAEWNNWY